MPNIEDYLAWRGDVPFSISPFNEVDALVLTELIYTNLDGVVPENGEKIALQEAKERFWRKYTREELLSSASFTKMAAFMMETMGKGARFGGMEISHYLNIVDAGSDLQLAAAVFWLPDGTAFAAFRGTDSTIVGWKEDFNMSYQPETEGQRRAAAYLNEHFAYLPIPLRVGGHSKGGNLAVYAAVKALPAVRDRILAVYDNDGPGFLEEFTKTPEYREMLPRIVCTVPEGTIIGTLLNNEAFQHVVKSTGTGIMQHDGFTWQVLGTKFVEAPKRSDASILIENTLKQWLTGKNEKDRRLFVQSLFSLVESTGAYTVDQIMRDKRRSLASMRKMLASMPREQREKVWNMLAELLVTGGGNVIQDAKRGLMTRLEAISMAGHEPGKKQEHTV